MTTISKEAVLDMAKETVRGRGKNYGTPEDNFNRIAARWRVHLRNRFNMDVPIDGASVALMMDDMKSARLENDITHLDSWVDKAGYTACGANIACEDPKSDGLMPLHPKREGMRKLVPGFVTVGGPEIDPFMGGTGFVTVGGPEIDPPFMGGQRSPTGTLRNED